MEEKWTSTRRLAACFDPLDGSGNADASSKCHRLCVSLLHTALTPLLK